MNFCHFVHTSKNKLQVFYISELMLYLSPLEILRANLSCLTMVGQIESDVFMYNQVYFYNPHLNTKYHIITSHKISNSKFTYIHNYHSTLPLCISIVTNQITPIHQKIFTHPILPTLFFVIYFCVINFERGCNA